MGSRLCSAGQSYTGDRDRRGFGFYRDRMLVAWNRLITPQRRGEGYCSLWESSESLSLPERESSISVAGRRRERERSPGLGPGGRTVAPLQPGPPKGVKSVELTGTGVRGC